MTCIKLRKHDAYSDSGVEWIPYKPAHWEIHQFKNVAFYQEGPGLRNWQFKDSGIKVICVTNIAPPKISFEKLEKFISIEEYKQSYTHFTVKKGDLLLASSGASWGKISVFEFEEKAILNTSTIRMHASRKTKVSTSFIRWVFQAGYIYDSLITLLTGSCQPNFGPSHLSQLFVLLPPLSEQNFIDNFLETTTRELDKKILLLSKKVTLYEQLKMSLVNETVTRGLDKNAEMKNSEVEWIGAVPIHWKIKRIAEVASQNKIKNIGLSEKNLLSLSYGRIIQKDLNSNFGLLPESFETYQIVKAGTIILRLTDLQNDQKSLRVGLVREKGIITSAYLGLCFNSTINPAFAYYLLHVYDLCKVFYWFGGGLRSTMRYDDIKVIPFFLPPSEEQDAIVKYLNFREWIERMKIYSILLIS